MTNGYKPFSSDYWVKLFSLILAIMIWFAIHSAIQRGIEPRRPLPRAQSRVFNDLPIKVLTAAGDNRIFRVTPATVDIQLTLDSVSSIEINSNDILPFVDLTGPANVKQKIFINAPAGVKIDLVNPPTVEVEQVGRISN